MNIRITALSAAVLLALSASAAAQTVDTPITPAKQVETRATDASMSRAPMPATDGSSEMTGTPPEAATATTTTDDAGTVSATTDATASAVHTSETDSTTLTDDEGAAASTDLPDTTDAAIASEKSSEGAEASEQAADDTAASADAGVPPTGESGLALAGAQVDDDYASRDGDGDKLLSRDEVAADGELAVNFDAIDKDDNELIAYGEWADREQLIAAAAKPKPAITSATGDTAAADTTAETTSGVAASTDTSTDAESDATVAGDDMPGQVDTTVATDDSGDLDTPSLSDDDATSDMEAAPGPDDTQDPDD